MENKKLIFNILSWVARITSLFFTFFVVFFFIMESNSSTYTNFRLIDILLFSCVPVLYGVGAFIGLKKPKIGGIIIIAAILIFNLIGWIYSKKFFDDFDFPLASIPGALYILESILKKK